MDIIVKLLVFLHMVGLIHGMAAGIAGGRMGPLLASSNDDQRSILFRLSKLLSMNGHIGLATLWVSGILLVWLKYDGVANLDLWFWVKLALVIVLTVLVGIVTVGLRRMRDGDMSAAPMVKRVSKINAVVGLAIIFCAAFAFS